MLSRGCHDHCLILVLLSKRYIVVLLPGWKRAFCYQLEGWWLNGSKIEPQYAVFLWGPWQSMFCGMLEGPNDDYYSDKSVTNTDKSHLGGPQGRLRWWAHTRGDFHSQEIMLDCLAIFTHWVQSINVFINLLKQQHFLLIPLTTPSYMLILTLFGGYKYEKNVSLQSSFTFLCRRFLYLHYKFKSCHEGENTIIGMHCLFF